MKQNPCVGVVNYYKASKAETRTSPRPVCGCIPNAVRAVSGIEWARIDKARMVVKLIFGAEVEPHLLTDSYGYRPNKSALDAIAVTRKRCWKHDGVLEFDIEGPFDNIPHDSLPGAVDKHAGIPCVRLYVRRWLTAPMQLADGTVIQREMGTPQGGVVSPVLANLFLHYAFDRWLQKHHPSMFWCSYADDGLVHCESEAQARFMLDVPGQGFEDCGLEPHPEKTRIVYCKDENRKGDHHNTAGAYVQFSRIAGLSLSDPIADELEIDGTISDVLARVDEKLKAHNQRRIDLVSADREILIENFPLAAIQQLVRNAVMHRDYETSNAPVRVTWFDDRIEILNPGGPFGAVTVENFGQPELTDYRNPNLAEAMKVLGYVQRFGVGIPSAKRLLSEAGHPDVVFTTTPTHVLVTVKAATELEEGAK